MSACQVVPLGVADRGHDAPGGDDAAAAALRRAGERMWPAWRSLEDWETASAAEFGESLAELVLLLWSVHRFAGTDAVILAQEISDFGVCDPLLQDVTEMAFALGAAWANALSRTAPRCRTTL
jgi:hypothetical protein